MLYSITNTKKHRNQWNKQVLCIHTTTLKHSTTKTTQKHSNPSHSSILDSVAPAMINTMNIAINKTRQACLDWECWWMMPAMQFQVLDISSLGHRKRILASLGDRPHLERDTSLSPVSGHRFLVSQEGFIQPCVVCVPCGSCFSQSRCLLLHPQCIIYPEVILCIWWNIQIWELASLLGPLLYILSQGSSYRTKTPKGRDWLLVLILLPVQFCVNYPLPTSLSGSFLLFVFFC